MHCSIIPDPVLPTPLKTILAEANKPYDADNVFHQIVNRVQIFEAETDDEHEVWMQASNSSQPFSLKEIGYKSPNLIWFRGVLANSSGIELIQHVTQINFSLLSVKRSSPKNPKCSIGFSLNPQS